MKDLEYWVAPNEKMLPEFIIGGAMKSGTTTLHQILNKHPKIFIPRREINFFDIDNILQHSDFNFYSKSKNQWFTQSMTSNPKELWDWYFSNFQGKEKYIKGEDSTTYLASKEVAKRIAIQQKPIKLIFILRQPTLRAYSNYWHLLRSGRATYTFEDTVRFNPFPILNRSLYKDQLDSYYNVLPQESIKVILFEELIANPQDIIKEICDFIGIDFNEFPNDLYNMHSNKGKIPLSISFQITKNRLARSFGNAHYINQLPIKHYLSSSSDIFINKNMNKLISIINPPIRTKIPKIKSETKLFLDQYFYRELQGINELVGKDVLSTWFTIKDK